MLASLALARHNWSGEILFLTDSVENNEIHGFRALKFPDNDSRQDWDSLIGENRIDLVMPVRDHRIDCISCKTIGWIPDFQHLRMPDLFDLDDLIWRDRLLSRVAGLSDLLILSSESAKKDFAEFFPPSACKARIASFPSQLWSDKIAEPIDVLKKYNLPARYFLVANQFWKHKNHKILPKALSVANKDGYKINIILTGQPVDYRDPDNNLLSALFQECSNLGVRDSVVFLGQLPRNELLSILRCAIAVIQPSKFEGWNTTIEDAKAIGKPVIASNISVHREQLGENGCFFESDSYGELAKILCTASKDWSFGINPESEKIAIEVNKNSAYAYGNKLIAIAEEALTQVDSSKIIHQLASRISKNDINQLKLSTIVQQQADHIEWLKNRCQLLEEGFFIPSIAQTAFLKCKKFFNKYSK
jgi:glycosyltransferase involved in cell wall biosynthesis